MISPSAHGAGLKQLKLPPEISLPRQTPLFQFVHRIHKNLPPSPIRTFRQRGIGGKYSPGADNVALQRFGQCWCGVYQRRPASTAAILLRSRFELYI
jgi:hypothetical protein